MSSTRTPKREGPDDYQTPIWAAELIFARLQPSGSFLEPCRGIGNIFGVARRYCTPRASCEITDGVDFLTWHLPDLPNDVKHFNWIITNPPFNKGIEFLERSLHLARNVAFLLRLNFLGSQKRNQFWKENPPTALFVLSKRPSFVKGATDSIEYGWFVWSIHHHGIHVLP